MKKEIELFIYNSYYTFKANNSDYSILLYSISKIINPVLQLMFFYYIQEYVRQGQDIGIYIVGNLLLLSIPNSVYSLGRILTYERNYGTLKLIELSSEKKFLVYFSRAFFYIIESSFTIIIALIFSIVFLKFKMPIAEIFKLFLIIVVTNFSVMGFGIFIGSFGLLMRSILLLVNTCYLILIAFSGANYSIINFPEWIQDIIMILPLQRGIEVAKLLYSNNYLDYQLLLKELGIGFFYYIIGYKLIYFLSKKAKINGSFDLF